MIEVKKSFEFLIQDYGMNYEFQTFNLGGGWIISAYSFYNETGCFTVHSLEGRGELAFYYAKKFSNNMEQLYGKAIMIYDYEKELWDKKGKILWFDNIFFWWNNNKILEVAVEVVKRQIAKHGEFFGIRVN